MNTSDAPRTAVIIPALNEAATIESIIREIRERHGHTVIVVDDRSQDETAAIARAAGAVVLSHADNLGAWGAMQTGLRHAERARFKRAVTMDADGQHLPEMLPALLAPLEEDRADVVIGSCVSRGSILRQIAWMFFRNVARLKVRDLTSGFRAYNARAMAELTHKNATLLDYQDLGVLLLLLARGLRLEEVEVCMRARKVGKSKIFCSWWKVGEYMLQSMVLTLSKTSFRNGACTRKC
jgi:hypothetical protein